MFNTNFKLLFLTISGPYSHKLSLILLLLVSLSFNSCTSSKVDYPKTTNTGIIPKPQQLDKKEGIVHFNENWSIFASQELFTAKENLKHFLQEKCKLTPSENKNSKQLKLLLDESLDLNHEAYRLSITESEILIQSNHQAGVLRGIASLKQLLILNEYQSNYFLPILEINDFPGFQHRGLLLDCSRHFFKPEVVKKYIDLLALFKLNTLHWHITEDQGWRIAIEKYPKLTKIGAFRTELDGSKYGGFYTKEEIREIVNYAQKKQIKIIPEIELPGHSQAAIASYPRLSCTGEAVSVANDWGVFKEIYCAGNDSVFVFLEDVLTEVMDLFPSKEIHIGGDEAPKIRWEQCAKCQKRIQVEGLADEYELQSYFIKRIQAFLNQNGRTLIGWDEILEGGLAKGATVQSWRGMKGGVEAVKGGNRAIMSPTSHAYLDYGLDAIDLEKVYHFNPIPEGLSPQEAELIIGGECNMWTEHVPNEKVLDSKVFPRMLAMAEVLWSDSLNKNYKEFNGRVQNIYMLLEKYEVNYGEESVAMNHIISIKENQARVKLIPYSNQISLQCKYDCEACDSSSINYTNPILITKSGRLKIQPFKGAKKYGPLIEIPFAQHNAIGATATYKNKFSDWYTAGGNQGLTDAKLGTLNFRDGAWQGFWGDDLEVVLELKSEQSAFNSVSANFYQYNNSWIFIPPKMEISVSDDGESWKSMGQFTSQTNPKKRGKFIDTFKIEMDQPVLSRFIKIHVQNFGKVPEWHEAAGSDAWIFIDEIMVH